ncbi:hypothetical protein OPQ81_010196 [Rhizoctonia solani]|nr:hypothetical protein OPQ81_010196 [Rhizoctonia solani]
MPRSASTHPPPSASSTLDHHLSGSMAMVLRRDGRPRSRCRVHAVETSKLDYIKRGFTIRQKQTLFDRDIRRSGRVSNSCNHALRMVLQKFIPEPVVLPVLPLRVLWWSRLFGMY